MMAEDKSSGEVYETSRIVLTDKDFVKVQRVESESGEQLEMKYHVPSGGVIDSATGKIRVEMMRMEPVKDLIVTPTTLALKKNGGLFKKTVHTTAPGYNVEQRTRQIILPAGGKMTIEVWDCFERERKYHTERNVVMALETDFGKPGLLMAEGDFLVFKFDMPRQKNVDIKLAVEVTKGERLRR